MSNPTDPAALSAEALLTAYDDAGWELSQALADPQAALFPLRDRMTALRAELLRRLRIVDAVAARLSALVDADAVGLNTPAAAAEIEALFRLAPTAAPPPA